MPVHQRARSSGDHRHNARLHVVGMPGVELRARMGGERTQTEIQKRINIQSPGFVIFIKSLIARFVMRAVEHTALDQELTPFIIGVAGKQGVV